MKQENNSTPWVAVDPNELLTPADVMPWLRQTNQALAQMRYRGKGPKFIKVTAKKVLYRRRDVEEWLDTKTANQTGQVD